MDKKHEITLATAKDTLKEREQVFRASDFLPERKIEELHEINARGRKIVRPYDEVDAFAAEVLARFGWHAYRAWKTGERDERGRTIMTTDQLFKYIAAERARTTAEGLPLQYTVVGAMAGANHPTKHKNAPKTLKNTIKFLKEQQKKAKGAQ